MVNNRTFQIAFLISLIVHVAVLVTDPDLNLTLSPFPKKQQDLKISYLKEPLQVKRHAQSDGLRQSLKLPPQIDIKEKISLSLTNKENTVGRNKKIISPQVAFIKPTTFVKPDIIAIKKKITLPAVDMEKIDNPSYPKYYHLLRDKIRRAAYQNYTRNETGEVYLSFVVSRDGYLKEVRLIEEKSVPNLYLREVALRSIKEASPLPRFPNELSYPELSFNVIISFETE